MDYFEMPVTFASFMKECVLSFVGGLMFAALMLSVAIFYFKLFKKKKVS